MGNVLNFVCQTVVGMYGAVAIIWAAVGYRDRDPAFMVRAIDWPFAVWDGCIGDRIVRNRLHWILARNAATLDVRLTWFERRVLRSWYKRRTEEERGSHRRKMLTPVRAVYDRVMLAVLMEGGGAHGHQRRTQVGSR